MSGRLLVVDRYISDNYIDARYAYVGLAAPGDVGSWQRESKVFHLTLFFPSFNSFFAYLIPLFLLPGVPILDSS